MAEPVIAPPQPQAQLTLAESATAYANADAAVKGLELKRVVLAQQLADLDADIAAASKSRDTAHAALLGSVKG